MHQIRYSLLLFIVVCRLAAAQGECTSGDHWGTLPPLVAYCIDPIPFEIEEDVLKYEAIDPGYSALDEIISFDVQAVCFFPIPCDYVPFDGGWSEEKETNYCTSISAGLSTTARAELGIKLVAEVGAQAEYDLEGKFEFCYRLQTTVSADYTQADCVNQYILVQKSFSEARGRREYVSEIVTWELNPDPYCVLVWDLYPSGLVTTECGLERMTGSADNIHGYVVTTDLSICCSGEDCCGRVCDE